MGNVQTAASAQEVLWRQAPSGELVDPVSYTHLTLPTNREV